MSNDTQLISVLGYVREYKALAVGLRSWILSGLEYNRMVNLTS